MVCITATYPMRPRSSERSSIRGTDARRKKAQRSDAPMARSGSVPTAPLLTPKTRRPVQKVHSPEGCRREGCVRKRVESIVYYFRSSGKRAGYHAPQ